LLRYRNRAYGEGANVKDVTVMTMIEANDRVGDRVRVRRQSLGLSLETCAGLAGINKSTLSRIERGINGGDNRFIIANLAKALRCPVEYLTGVVVPGGRDGAEVTAATYETVRSLITADLDFDPEHGLLTPIDQLTERVGEAVQMRQACDYATLTRRLPALVRDTYAATAGPDRRRALALFVRLAEAASFAVRYTGQPAAASIAADRARQAAVMSADPVLLAFAEWARAHAALGCGLHERAALITSRAIADLDQATAAGEGRLEMLGMLHLTTAFALVGAGRMQDAVDPLAEANVLAQNTGETDTFALMFGPTNVRLWELAIITDGGDPLDAMPLIAETNPLIIPSASRQTCFYLDAGRALAKLGEDGRAVQMIETAERIAPQRVHGDPIVVETVRGLLDTARRRAAGTRLRALAERVGVAA
jgi:transcriptional regulator with XRE-family HTH domain